MIANHKIGLGLSLSLADAENWKFTFLHFFIGGLGFQDFAQSSMITLKMNIILLPNFMSKTKCFNCASVVKDHSQQILTIQRQWYELQLQKWHLDKMALTSIRVDTFLIPGWFSTLLNDEMTTEWNEEVGPQGRNTWGCHSVREERIFVASAVWHVL